MKRTLALAICVGLASGIAAYAEPKDKEEKEEQKLEKAAKKIERRANREARQNERFERRVENLQPQVTPEMNVEPQVTNLRPRGPARAEFQPQMNANVDAPIVRRRDRVATIERRGPSNYSWSYDEARRFHRRGVRDRSWYERNYDRFALFGGGYYYFDRGYWYPAYGYDTRYTTYRFDEPIYGYNSLEPGQVLVNVQRQLRREGYYRGAIDGLIGPQTRAALARYQRDNGLYVTRAIDGPTLAALGLT
jgi:hypothetical protein